MPEKELAAPQEPGLRVQAAVVKAADLAGIVLQLNNFRYPINNVICIEPTGWNTVVHQHTGQHMQRAETWECVFTYLIEEKPHPQQNVTQLKPKEEWDGQNNQG